MRHARQMSSAARSSVARDPRFNTVTPQDIAYFKSIDPRMVIEDASEVASYTTDWMGVYSAKNPSLVLKPRDTSAVSSILKHCNERRLAVVPQGGNTGLVGGSVPVFDEIVLSTTRMNTISNIDDASGTVQVEAGVVLEALENELREHQLTIPIDLGAKGSACLGGNIATNAGGVHLLRYGSLHASVLGLEVVKPDGTVLDLMNSLRKDNTGYHLRNLFIGSEGTLGVITKAVLAVPQLPRSKQVAFLGCDNYDDVLKLLISAKSELGEVLSAFEVLDDATMALLISHEKKKNPLTQRSAYYVLVEAAGSNAEHDEAKMMQFAESVLEGGIASDGTIAQDSAQMEALWGLRESSATCAKKVGRLIKFDVSLPLKHYYEFIEAVRERVGDRGATIGYGHIGDGNVHLNIGSLVDDSEILPLLEPFVYEWIEEKGGSISAEHGVGLQKAGKLRYSKSDEAIKSMKQIKQVFDPNEIMNPYKMF